MSEMDVSRETVPAGAHYCSACGQVHSVGTEDAGVRIAQINADRDIELARIARSETRAMVETNAETDIAVAEIHAEAGVAEAEALAAGIADSGAAADPEVPVITDVPIPEAEPEVQDTIEPREDEGAPPAPAKSKLSYWP